MSIPDQQRLIDLVRHQRAELHDAGLISDEEYVALVTVGSEAARRLESYDEVRALLDAALKERDEAEGRADRLHNDRAALLNVKTREGMGASEWMMRTATAERERDAAVARTERLEQAISACRERFARYALIHLAKDTTQGLRKARENEEMVDLCDAALGRQQKGDSQ